MINVNVDAQWGREPGQWKISLFERLTGPSTQGRLNAHRKCQEMCLFCHDIQHTIGGSLAFDHESGILLLAK
jgi:hypothetical protein